MLKKRYPLFLALLVVSVLLMIYQSRNGAYTPFGFLSGYLNSASKGTAVAGSSIKGTLGRFKNKDEELQKLRDEVRDLRLREQEYKEAVLENVRLKDALCLKERREDYIATAKVVSKGTDRWSNALVIDKGKADFVGKDMAVITADGLLGKVQEAHGFSSTVLLIDDTIFRAAVRLEESRAEAVLSGAGPGLCILKYVGAEVEVKPGDVVITSGLDGLFPPGLLAGYVSKVVGDEGFFHRVEVTPFADSRKAEEVVVVRK